MNEPIPAPVATVPAPLGPPPLSPGAQIAPDYRVVGLLRRGRELDVYDLWSESRRCRCVGKTVRPDRLEDSEVRARLLREGRLLLQLTHPHIVRAYQVVTTPVPLVVIETLPGETLSHLIARQRGKLSAKAVAFLGLHLCSAVAYLHSKDILHLDLKSSNVIATHGMAKVLDLSLARRPGPHRGGIGTRGYRAPEQALGGNLGEHTDVWGIGATLYEAITGKSACEPGTGPPVSGPETTACRPEPVRQARRINAALANAIDRALSVDPGHRPAVDELAVRLEEVIRAAQETSRRRAARLT